MSAAAAGPDAARADVGGVVARGGTAPGDDVARCPGCAAPLAGDERFCLACGLRLALDELRLAALPLLASRFASATPALGATVAGPASRRALVRSAAITALAVLALGIAIGATVGPAAVEETSAAQRAVVLVSATPAASPTIAGDDAPLDEDAAGGGAPDAVQLLADAGGDTTDADAGPSAPADAAPVGDAPSAEQAPAADDPGDDGTPPAAAPPGSQPLAGAVVGSAADGEGFVLAQRDGTLLRVHASGCAVALGDDLHLRARPLANGTWAADRVRRVGERAGEVRVAGTVDWVDPASGRYALGARGVTLLVAIPPAPAAAAAVPAPTPAAPAPTAPAPTAPTAPTAPAPVAPALGARLVVRVAPASAADDGRPELVERARADAPPPADPAAPAPPLELAGLVQSLDAQRRTLVLALDPDAQPPLTVVLAVPPQLRLARLLPNQRVALTATAAPDGALALSGASPDGDALAADDASGAQGDQAPSAPPAADQPPTTVASCAVLEAPARATRDLKTFTPPPPDRNERSPGRS